MPLKINLDPSISSIDLYNTARFMLEKYYENSPDTYFDSYDIEEEIKTNYLDSMFDNLLNLFKSIGVSFPTDDVIVIVNVVYRLKGLRESIEYLFKTVLKCDFVLDYDYINFKFDAKIDNLSIDNLTKFNIYLKRLVDELFYTKEYQSELINLTLTINIVKELSYGISQTYFNDFHVKYTENKNDN
jgi:hypothetical protein